MLKKSRKRQLKRSQFILSEKEIKELFFNAGTFRNKIIILLLWKTGIRSFECAGLRIHDIQFPAKRLHIIGKFEKDRYIPLNQNTLHELQKYIKYETQKKQIYLFPSPKNKDKPLVRHRINTICRHTGELAKIKNPDPDLKYINPHIFRHTFAHTLKNKGFEAREIADLLGHDSVVITQDFYSKTPFKTLCKKIQRFLD